MRTARLMWTQGVATVVAVTFVLIAGLVSSGHGQGVAESPVAVFRGRPGAMAEAAVAADPARPGHLAAAADPYLGLARILVATSDDGGASWSSPTPILPDGFAKSYDPSLAFDDNGDLLVVGGASGQGAPHCQVGSAIFLARVRGLGARYTLLRDARRDRAYVDRPALAMARASHPGYVSWTESSGSGAECRGTPRQSVTMVASMADDDSLSDSRPVPSSGLSAPFGSALAVGPDGVLNVAVVEHSGDGSGRLVLVRSPDGGSTFEGPVVVDRGPDVAESIAGLGGLIAPIASIATSADNRVALAWSTGRPRGATTSVFEAPSGGTWRAMAPPDDGVTSLFPSVAYDSSGLLWLLVARARDGALDIDLRSRGQDWGNAVRLGGGPASAYIEIGESLGLASTAASMVAAFPLDGPSASSLEVGRLTLPARPSSTAGQPPATAQLQPRRGGRGQGNRARYVLGAGAMALLGACGAGTLLLRRRRQRRG